MQCTNIENENLQKKVHALLLYILQFGIATDTGIVNCNAGAGDGGYFNNNDNSNKSAALCDCFITNQNELRLSQFDFIVNLCMRAHVVCISSGLAD